MSKLELLQNSVSVIDQLVVEDDILDGLANNLPNLTVGNYLPSVTGYHEKIIASSALEDIDGGTLYLMAMD